MARSPALLAALLVAGSASAAGVQSANAPRMAFVSPQGGAFDVWTARLDGRLTRTKAYDSFPAWSPDGRRIVFVSDRRAVGKLWVVNADGRGLRRLTRGGSKDADPAWSPKGSLIAYASTARPPGIWLVRPDGTHARPLRRRGVGGGAPSWSPNARQIAFARPLRAGPASHLRVRDQRERHRQATAHAAGQRRRLGAGLVAGRPADRLDARARALDHERRRVLAPQVASSWGMARRLASLRHVPQLVARRLAGPLRNDVLAERDRSRQSRRQRLLARRPRSDQRRDLPGLAASLVRSLSSTRCCSTSSSEPLRASGNGAPEPD
jgi:Tol biopolymer transport system component